MRQAGCGTRWVRFSGEYSESFPQRVVETLYCARSDRGPRRLCETTSTQEPTTPENCAEAYLRQI